MNRSSRKLMALLSETITDRRTLLRSVAIGAGIAAFSPLLAACADEGEEDDESPADEEDGDSEVVDEDSPADEDESDEDESDDDPAAEEEDDEEDDVPDDAEGVFGGTLTVAIVSPVSSLDVQSITFNTRMPGQHIFETLLTYGEDYSTQPLLAETWEWDDEGLVLTLGLRDDVLFHNGDPLEADDVIASLERYGEAGSRGVVGEIISSLTEVDTHTVNISVDSPNSGLLPMLASPLVYIAIMPREHIEGKANGEIEAAEDLIGTGPYMVDEWNPDAELHLVRFDDYYQTEGERDGYAGAKIAYFDRVVFVGVPETGTRISGLLAGDNDFALELPRPERSRLEDDPDVEPVVGGPGTSQTVVFNHFEGGGWSNDVLFRRAVQAAVNVEEIANLAVAGDEDFYELNHSIYRTAQGAWWSDVAEDTYNQADPERARELLDEAGYDGEEIILVYDVALDIDVAIATVLPEQLAEAGIQVTAQGVDSATRGATRSEAEGWQMLTDGMSVRFTPADWDATLNCETNRAGWCNEEMQAAFEDLQGTLDEDEQKPLSDEVQRLHHEDVFAIKLHDEFELDARRSDIVGFEAWYLQRFWGVWREE